MSTALATPAAADRTSLVVGGQEEGAFGAVRPALVDLSVAVARFRPGTEAVRWRRSGGT